MAHFWVIEKVKTKKILTKLLITQNALIFGLWLWNKLGTFISWLWHCTEHKRCKVFTFFENSTFLIFFSLLSVHYMSKTPLKKFFYLLKFRNLGIHGFRQCLLAAKHSTVCIQCENKNFFEVLGVSQGLLNLVSIYKLVILNTLFSSKRVIYRPNAHERAYWQRWNHL